MRWNVNFKIELGLKMSLFWILRFLVSCFFYLSPSSNRPFCWSYYPQNSKVTSNFCRTYGSAEVKKKGNSTLLQHNHRYSPPLPPAQLQVALQKWSASVANWEICTPLTWDHLWEGQQYDIKTHFLLGALQTILIIHFLVVSTTFFEF